MTRIDEIRERLDKARPGLGEIDGGEDLQNRRGNPKGSYTWTLYGTYPDAILLVNARNDIAYLLDTLACRDQRCEDLAVQLDAGHHELTNTDAPTDAEVQAAARALIDFDGTNWDSLGPVGRNTYSNAARAALVAAREVSGR